MWFEYACWTLVVFVACRIVIEMAELILSRVNHILLVILIYFFLLLRVYFLSL